MEKQNGFTMTTKYNFFIAIVCSINISFSITKCMFMFLRLQMYILINFKQKKRGYIFNNLVLSTQYEIITF